VVGTGVLGSLTTFSTFAADTADLVEDDPSRFHAVGYVVLTLVFGIGAAWLGLAISE
jgi:CrcB protein